jgi:hypothetical protein
MSLDQLKDQVAHLAPEAQRELIAFMVSLQTERNDEFKQHLAQKIDDSNPAHWFDLDEARKKLSE